MEPQLDTDATALQAEVVQDLWQQELLSLPPDQFKALRQRGLSPPDPAQGLGATRWRTAAAVQGR